MIPEAPLRAKSKTPKPQSLWVAVNGAPEGLSAEETSCDGPETETTHIIKPHESDQTHSTKTQYRQVAPVAPMSVPPSQLTVTGGQTAARTITIQHCRRSLCKPRPLPRPAYLDVGVDAALYGPIYGMSTAPAKVQAVEEDRPEPVDGMLDQREREMDCKLLEWRDAYLVRARGDRPLAERASSGFTGMGIEDVKSGSGRKRSGKPGAPMQLTEGGLKQSVGGKQVVQKSTEGGAQRITATTKRILPDTSPIISLKRVCQATECDKISDSVPHMTAGLFTESNQVPQNLASHYGMKSNNTDMMEYFMTTEAAPPLLISEVMEYDQPEATIVHRITPPSPKPGVEDRIQFSHDRGSEATAMEINGWMTVKRAEMALEELRQEHENWKKTAEVINTTISKHISGLSQLHNTRAATHMVRRSPLLTALAEVNLQILDELQKGIPEVTLHSLIVKRIPQTIPESPRGDIGESEYARDSVDSGGGEGSEDREEPSHSDAADKFRFEILEDDEGETWVELCKPPRLGGKS